MIETTTNQFNWWLPLYGALGATIVCLPKVVFGNDIGTFLVTGIIAAILCLILLVLFFLKIRRQTLPALAMVAAFLSVSWLLFHISDDVRTAGRWLIGSKRYKAEVLAQPKSAINKLKHVEWDGWGFAGSGTLWCISFSIQMILSQLPPRFGLLAGSAASHARFPTSAV
jgi:hypothetical protein